MPHGERSCGNSAVLIEVSPGGGAAAGVGALVPGAAAFAGLGSAMGATSLVAGDCATCDVAAGAGGEFCGRWRWVGGRCGGSDNWRGCGERGGWRCRRRLRRRGVGRGTRAHRGGSIGLGVAEWANAISGRNAASIANVLKRNCKVPFDADRTTPRQPRLHQSSVFMSHPPKAPRRDAMDRELVQQMALRNQVRPLCTERHVRCYALRVSGRGTLMRRGDHLHVGGRVAGLHLLLEYQRRSACVQSPPAACIALSARSSERRA